MTHWKIAPQTLTTRFDDNAVSGNETATLEISSNRGGGYIVTIAASGLNCDALETIWGEEQEIEFVEEDDDLVGVQVDTDEEFNTSSH